MFYCRDPSQVNTIRGWLVFVARSRWAFRQMRHERYEGGVVALTLVSCRWAWLAIGSSKDGVMFGIS